MKVTYAIILKTEGGRMLVRQVTFANHDITSAAKFAAEEAHWSKAEVVSITAVTYTGY